MRIKIKTDAQNSCSFGFGTGGSSLSPSKGLRIELTHYDRATKLLSQNVFYYFNLQKNYL